MSRVAEMSHEVGEFKPAVKPHAERPVSTNQLDGEPRDWLFDRLVPAGDFVIACFHHAYVPHEEIQLPLRKEEAIKLAQAIGGLK